VRSVDDMTQQSTPTASAQPTVVPAPPAATAPGGALHGIDGNLATALGWTAAVIPLAGLAAGAAGLGWPVPVAVGLLLSMTWVAVALVRRTRRPLATLGLAGVIAALTVTVTSTVFSPALTGELQGPLASLVGFPLIVAASAVWGVSCGLVVRVLRRPTTR
jgi:hypothetical protein